MSERSTGRMYPTPTVGDHWAPSTPASELREWKKNNLRGVAAADRPQPASNQLTLFAEAFPVSPTPWLASVPAAATSAISGPPSLDSFASVNPDGSWRKTSQGYSQVTLDGSLEPFSETWPRAGMTLSVTAYRLPPRDHFIGEREFGSWPTPTGRDHKDGTAKSCENVPTNGLLGRVIHLPTPTVGDSKNARNSTAVRHRIPPTGIHAGDTLTDVVVPAGGSLNPAWVEILMGYPKGWTEL
jgi:hypothetical protein